MPNNIVLLFLLPYSPELNTAEKIWQNFKRQFSNNFFKTFEELEQFVCELSNGLNKEQVKNICGYGYIFANLFRSAM